MIQYAVSNAIKNIIVANGNNQCLVALFKVTPYARHAHTTTTQTHNKHNTEPCFSHSTHSPSNNSTARSKTAAFPLLQVTTAQSFLRAGSVELVF
jgi:hypothetical protein